MRVGGRGRAAAVALALALVAAVVACTGDDGGSGRASDAARSSEAEPIVGGTLRLGISRLTSLDPADVSPESPSSSIAADLLYDDLPALSEGSSTLDGGVTWTFTLRAGASFADGRPVTSIDVEASLERVLAREGSSIAARARELIAEVRAVDAAVVEVVLARPFTPLPALLATPVFGIVSAEAAAAGDPSVNGSGPFRLAAVDGDVVRLVRAREGAAYLDGVELHQHDDLGDAVESFAAGRLDWTLVPPARAEAVAEVYGADGYVPFHAELLLAFDLADPTFADVRFRRAIAAAVDRDAAVAAVYFGVADPLPTIVPAGVVGHDPGRCGVGCAHDPRESAALLAEAFPDGNVPEVVLGRGDGADDAALAQVVAEQLQAAGIPAALAPAAPGAGGGDGDGDDGGLVRLGRVGVWPDAQAYLDPLFRTGADDNVTGFSDPSVDLLLDAALLSFDAAERVRLLAQAESLVLAAAAVVPVAQFRLLSASSPAVQDLTLAVDGTFDAESVWLAG